MLIGPPAVGKLTVAEELGRRTGFKVFHNHLTQDLAKELYPAFDETRFGLVEELRLVTVKYAAEHGTDLIHTFAHSGSSADDKFLDVMIDAVEQRGGRVRLVQLTASHDDLTARIANPSRQRFHKLTDSAILQEKLAAGVWLPSLDGKDALVINTSEISPAGAARQIVEHFALATRATQHDFGRELR